MKFKIKTYIKNNTKLHSVCSNVKIKIFSAFECLFRLIPIQQNKIVICNYYGKGYGDNGKYIAEEIIKQGLNYDVVWLLREELVLECKVPPQVRIVRYGSLKGLYELATSKIWIDNCRKIFYPKKRKEQYYIQTWHGGIALKRIEKDAEKNLGIDYLKDAKHDSNIADLFISNSKFCTNMYQSAFWYEGKILEIGSPRCDVLINKSSEVDKKIRKYFNINDAAHIVIYAPTFRANLNTKVYDVDFNRLIKVLKKKFGGEWVVLVRLHPNISSKDNSIKYHSNIINATGYDDMYELLAASDILITDYSSTMFEFSFTHKPVFLYASDIKDYVEDRNFYFDIYSLPYPLAKDNGQLLSVIEQFDENKYLNELNILLSKIGVLEYGKASTKVVEKINKIIVEDKNSCNIK